MLRRGARPAGHNRLRPRAATAGLGALVALLAAVVLGVAAPSALASCAAPANPIEAENCQPGNPASEWQVSGAGDANLQGFTTDLSVDQGQTVRFKVRSNAADYRLDVYRMGYYGGSGARRVATVQPSATLPQTQPDCLTQPTTGLVDCGNWAVSASWAVPANAVSGIYFARLVREAGGTGASHVMFVVRDDDSGSDLLFQTSDTTWQAYNRYGGNSLYTGGPGTNPGRAYKVSYNRPFTTREYAPEDWVFNAEYPMVRWLERNGYDMSYATGIDSDRSGAELREHDSFLSVGHDEYWSGPQRANVEAARNAGVNLAFFSGNEMFWKTRWEASIDGSSTDRRTLVSYKETHANQKIDPQANTWTGTWRDGRSFNPEGGRPENALTGTAFKVNSGTKAVRVPDTEGKLRLWRNTTVANLAPGATATMPTGTLGYEWDEEPDNGSRPPGLMRLSSATETSGLQILQDEGSQYGSGSATHNLTMYKVSNAGAPDARVFGAGTVQWSWGLDDQHDRGNAAADVRMQQATMNLLADMRAQPATRQTNLVAATASADTTAPTSGVTFPAAGATVERGTPITITGTASDLESSGRIGGVEVSVDGQTWHPATGRESWQFSWTPDANGTATIRVRAVDDSGNLQSPVTTRTVTVGGTAPPAGCPCSIFQPASVPQNAAQRDGQAIEVGVKFRSDEDGFITGLRFYKGAANTGTHVGHLWSRTGQQLAEATFTNESASGWQQVQLSNPVAVTRDTTYVASYHSSDGWYAYSSPFFTTPADNPPLHGLATGVDGGNGVYKYGASGFPSSTYNSSNYWIDVTFAPNSGPDTRAPRIASVAPPENGTGVDATARVTAVFDEPMAPTSISGATVSLRGPGGTAVPATVTYDAGGQLATLAPQSALAASTTYTATVKGGTGGVTDIAGNALTADKTWTFTTAAPAPPPPTEGPGGPILVITSGADPFTGYYAEIMRAEGLNAFRTADLSTVTAQTLAAHQVVVLAQTGLTDAQTTMLTTWVQGGGNLIAMRPDKKLAGLLGLTDAGATLAESYMKVAGGSGPGNGIETQTMQFHGTADRYGLNGASTVATLYSSATAATTNPAVTLRDVGSAGGQAAAFTYDLARSVIGTRQGNLAWTNDERDGFTPLRPDDLFFGAKSGNVRPDWVDLNKVAIPQADEQQRLLANLITSMNLDKTPLPRFWYLPRGEEAAVVMTGDDHANGGTVGQFNTFKSQSPANCNVADWECVRASSYVYPNTPITDAQATGFQADGFEIGLHTNTNCDNYTRTSLRTLLTSQLSAFAASWPSLASPKTNRNHCIAWSGWVDTPLESLAKGIRFDTNYYYWPGNWVQDRPGHFTGSGFPQRFADTNGATIDVYQANTQITDESGQSIPATIKALIDKAVGSEGYYGVVTTNMHTDNPSHPGADAIVAEATGRGVPVVSAKQMLEWVDGRNASSYAGLGYEAATGRLSFTVAPGAGSRGLQGMVPVDGPAGSLEGLTRAGNAVSTTTKTIKGVRYALFSAAGGSYVATYGSAPSDTTAPSISAVAATARADGTATVSWTTDEESSSRVRYGTSPTALTGDASDASRVTSHSVNLSGLTAGTTYHFRVSSTDAAGNTGTSPAEPAAPATFNVPAAPGATLTDSSLADFAGGVTGTGTFAGSSSDTADGEVQLAPTIGDEFAGSALPAGWTATPWGTGGTGTVGGGLLTVDGARAGPTATYAAGRTLEFVATFANAPYQHAGFGVDYNSAPWAMFSTGGGSLPVGLYVRSHPNGTNTSIPGVSLTVPHRYKIVWTATNIEFWVDGTRVATHNTAITTAMRPLVSDYNIGGSANVRLHWLRMSPYTATGTFTSRVLDSGKAANDWTSLDTTAAAPAGTTVAIETRSGATATPDGSWSAWQAATGGTVASPNGRYLQYRATLTSTATSVTPALERVSVGSAP